MPDAEEYDGRVKRQVLTGMVVSTPVLAAIASRWEPPGLWDDKASNLVGNWCVRHHAKYGKAPGRALQGYFDSWAESGRADPDTVKMVERFLAGLSDEYGRNGDGPSPDYLLDLAAREFTLVRQTALAEGLLAVARARDPDRGEALVAAHRKVDVGQSGGVSVLAERSLYEAALAKSSDTIDLFTYPDALGNFFRGALTRGSFVAWEGPTKVGKSFFLLDAAWRAMLQGCKVAFFETGDMTRNQFMRRVCERACVRPWQGDPDHPVRMPVHIAHAQTGLPDVGYRERTFAADLTPDGAWAAVEKIKAETGGDIRLGVYPNDSVTVVELEQEIATWHRHGWGPPDVVVIDYMDLLAPIDRRDDERAHINRTWQAGRALNQRLDCLLVVGTQTDTPSYSARRLGRANFSGDRRKNDHVMGMVGINQDEKEKRQQLYRLNWAVPYRELDFPSDVEVWCAACLDCANPCVKSCV